MKNEYSIGDSIYIDGTKYTLLDAKLLTADFTGAYAGYSSMILIDSDNKVYVWEPYNTSLGIKYILSPARESMDTFYNNGCLYDDPLFTERAGHSYGIFVEDELGRITLSDNNLNVQTLDFSQNFTEEELKKMMGEYSVPSENIPDVNDSDSNNNTSSQNSNSVLGSSFSNCTFAVNGQYLKMVVNKLKESATTVDSIVSNIYKLIDVDLREAWSGEDYESFSSMCHMYENTFRDLSVLLYAFADMYSNVSNEVEVLYDNVMAVANIDIGGDVYGN